MTFSLKLVFGPGGPALGLRAVMNRITAMNKAARSKPGNTPAMKSFPMDSSVRMPYMMNPRLGGSIVVMNPEGEAKKRLPIDNTVTVPAGLDPLKLQQVIDKLV